MAPSIFIEKLKVGKRFVLMQLIVRPQMDANQSWDSAGSNNKFVSQEVWQLLYRKLDQLCQRHFGERKEKYTLDKEYETRLEEQPNYLIKYEFRDGNVRNNLNVVFNENERKLYTDCLFVELRNEARQMHSDLLEARKIVERLQKENETLRAIPPAASQEYTPTPLAKSATPLGGSSNHSEYVPLALNGNSPVHHGRYKASKIDDTIKPEPDPYTPSSSQDASEASTISYIPGVAAATLSTPVKPEELQERIVTASSSGESRIQGKRRRCRNAEIFGNSDEEDQPSSSTKAHNRSVDNIFSQESPTKSPVMDLIGSSSEEMAGSSREKLPRKTKVNIEYNLSISPEGDKTSGKRRRKETATEGDSKKSSKSGSRTHTKSGKIDVWLCAKTGTSSSNDGSSKATSKKDSESSSRDKQPKKSTKDVKVKKAPEPKLVVDREKLREETENMRKQCERLDKLAEMFPEDKTLQDVPMLVCTHISIDRILATFDQYSNELRQIFDQYKDQPERRWRQAEELCYFTDVGVGVFDDDEQKYKMLLHMERQFCEPLDYGKYTEILTSVLVGEWALRIWMAEHGYADRREALARLKLQEEANPMDITPSGLASLMGVAGSSKKRH